MFHSNANFETGLASLMQLANQASTNQVPSAQSSRHVSRGNVRAGNGDSKRKHHDLTKDNDGSSAKKRYDGLVNWVPPAPSKTKMTGIGGERKHHDLTRNDASSNMRQCNRYVSSFLNLDDCVRIDQVIQKAFEHQRLSPQNIAAVWSRLSRLMTITTSNHSQNQQQYQELGRDLGILLARTIDGLKGYGPIQLSQTALSMAKIIKAAYNCGNKRETNHQQVFHDLLVGRDMKRKVSLFQAIASAAVPFLPDFDPQGYSNLAYACAIANVIPRSGDGTLFDQIANAIFAKKGLGNFKPQALSNIVWAFATAKISNPRLFDKVASEVIEYRDLRSFTPQALSVIVWSYATAKISDHCLFEKVAAEVACRGLGSFDSQAISNILWAFAKANIAHPCMFDKVAYKVIDCRDLGLFRPQDFANIVWAFATAKRSNPRMFKKVSDDIASRDLRSFKPHEIAIIVWAYATAKISDHCLFEKVAAEVACRGLRSFDCRGIKNILWACATSGLVESPLFAEMEPRLAALLEQCNSQELANIAWSYAVADVNAPKLFNASFAKCLIENIDNFNFVELRQLYQWHLWQTEETSNTGLPFTLERKCYKAFSSTETKISEFQRDVVSVFRSIGLKPMEEVLTQRGYSLDALVEVYGKEVGIEVDGPTHFIGIKPTGSTLLKRRQIAIVEGIPLVYIPYWEWDEVGADHRKKQNYVRSLLKMN